MAAHVEVGVALIVRRDKSIMLQMRKGKHAPGCWGCPGGHLEKGESLELGAIREAIEEAGTGVATSQPKVWYPVNNFYEKEDKQVVTVFLLCDWIAGEPKIMEPEKCAEWKWHSWESLVAGSVPLMSGIQYLVDNNLDPFQPGESLALYLSGER